MDGSRHSPLPGTGRLPEATNGCFVEAKHEKPALSNGQLWRNPKVGSGSGHAGRIPRFIAEKPPLKLRFPEAADRQ